MHRHTSNEQKRWNKQISIVIIENYKEKRDVEIQHTNFMAKKQTQAIFYLVFLEHSNANKVKKGLKKEDGKEGRYYLICRIAFEHV